MPTATRNRRRTRAATRPDRPRRAGPLPALVSLDVLSAHWRIAFDAAQDSLGAAGHLGFPAGELSGHSALLVRERAATAELIDELAREEHVQLVHRLSAPRATRHLLGLPLGVTALVF